MDQKPLPKSTVLDCSYCGNRTPHEMQFEYERYIYFDTWENHEGVEEEMPENFAWLCYSCGTCGALNIYGNFTNVYGRPSVLENKLHPKGANLYPDSILSPPRPIPENIVKIYEEIWPLRHRSISSFAVQIRRLLEFVCTDQKAEGKTLFYKLQFLSSRGVFPGHFAKITELLKDAGNIGAHADETKLYPFDCDLIDDFFRLIMEYVYIIPARIKRMEERLKRRESENSAKEEKD